MILIRLCKHIIDLCKDLLIAILLVDLLVALKQLLTRDFAVAVSVKGTERLIKHVSFGLG